MDADIHPSSADGGVASQATTDAGWDALDAGTGSGPHHFVSVSPFGTGCPKDSASASISPDGKTTFVTFSRFEAIVDKTKSVDIENCQLGIKVTSPKGLSFGVADFRYEGYAYLEKGQTARALVSTISRGSPARIRRSSAAT